MLGIGIDIGGTNTKLVVVNISSLAAVQPFEVGLKRTASFLELYLRRSYICSSSSHCPPTPPPTPTF